MGALNTIGSATRVVVLALGNVPSVDATGLVALESALKRLQNTKTQVVLSGPLPQPRQVFQRADLPGHYANVRFADDLSSGIALARELTAPASSDSRNAV
jgi:SulP family sulfate permease